MGERDEGLFTSIWSIWRTDHCSALLLFTRCGRTCDIDFHSPSFNIEPQARYEREHGGAGDGGDGGSHGHLVEGAAGGGLPGCEAERPGSGGLHPAGGGGLRREERARRGAEARGGRSGAERRGHRAGGGGWQAGPQCGRGA